MGTERVDGGEHSVFHRDLAYSLDSQDTSSGCLLGQTLKMETTTLEYMGFIVVVAFVVSVCQVRRGNTGDSAAVEVASTRRSARPIYILMP